MNEGNAYLCMSLRTFTHIALSLDSSLILISPSFKVKGSSSLCEGKKKKNFRKMHRYVI